MPTSQQICIAVGEALKGKVPCDQAADWVLERLPEAPPQSVRSNVSYVYGNHERRLTALRAAA